MSTMTKMANKRIQLSNSILVAAVLIAVLLAGGCSGGKGKGSTIPEVYIGTAGVDVAFAPEGVPEVMTESSSSEAVLMISNKGAVDADIPSMIVKVQDKAVAVVFDNGKPVKVIGGNELMEKLNDPMAKTTGKLQGKVSNTIGSLDSITEPVTAKQMPGKDATNTGLLSTVCYKYETRLTANVCVDAAPFSFQKQRKPCDAKLPLSFQSQGAPVAVKKIETLAPEKITDKGLLEPTKEAVFVKPKFKIFFGNVGNGQVVDKDSLNMFCTDKDSGSTSDKAGIIRVDSVTLNGRELSCNSKSATLSGNLANDFVLCTYPENDFTEGSGAFATPIKVQLSYGYRSISNPVPVRIEKVTECNEDAERSCENSGTQKCISGHWTLCRK